MQASDNCVEFVKQFEGFSSTPYFDVAHRLTIGFGHLIKPGEKFAELDDASATDILKSDMQLACDAVNRYVTCDINQNQFDSLVDFTYNLGIGSLEKSHLLQYVNEGDFDRASGEFGKWIFAGGVISEGLERRRAAEKELFLTPMDA